MDESPLQGEQTKVRTEWAEGPPSHFAFDLFPPALDRLEGCLLSAMSVKTGAGVAIRPLVERERSDA